MASFAALVTFAVSGVVVVVGPALWSQWSGGVRLVSLAQGALHRRVRVYRPPEPPAHPGLLIDLHSSGSNGFLEQATTGMLGHARDRGWIVAYPDALADGWHSYGHDGGVDDVAFLAALIDRLRVTDRIDPGRVYVMGLSRGGMMAYRAACELASRVTAVAVVEGNMADETGSVAGAGCRPSRPVSVLAIHGTADSAVPITGGDGFAPFAAVVRYWRRLDGCAGTPSTTGPSTSTTWTCREGTQVTSLVVPGGHHAWPGAPLEGLPWTPAGAVDASGIIADFLAGQHRAPAG